MKLGQNLKLSTIMINVCEIIKSQEKNIQENSTL